MGQMRQRLGEFFLFEGGADIRRLAVEQKCLGEARHAVSSSRCSCVSRFWLRVTV